jgi:pimeloyl-ACP methyl ester carboxylesterase
MAEEPLPTAGDVAYEQLILDVDRVALHIATIRRGSTGDESRAPVVFLHGFGSTKEDYADIARHPAFNRRPFLAYDAPGCGQTRCADLSRVSIPLLVRTARTVLDRLGIERFHLVGHSMGGLTALLLARQDPGRVLSFVDIEGNLAPEDCFLSRQIITHPTDDPETFLADFADRARRSPEYSSDLYAASLRHNVRPDAVRTIFESMVELSDHGDLLSTFLALPFPRMFMYGEQNSSLSYLPKLAANGVETAEIPHSGHWPMYANPVAMWERIATFQAHTHT